MNLTTTTQRTCTTLLAALLTAVAAQASLITWHIPMDGLHEAVPTPSPGTGHATAMLDTVTGMLSVSGTFTSLMEPARAAHVHRGAPGIAGPVFLPLLIDLATSGSFSGSGVISAANQALLEAGMGYVNIHTAVFPAGEIRGDFYPALPESASLALEAMAVLAGLAGYRRWLKR